MSSDEKSAIQASDENAALILNAIKDTKTDLIERLATSDKHTNETFAAHEKRDQERFDETTQALVAHRTQLGEAIGGLTKQVELTNGNVKEQGGKIAIIEDRAGVLAAAKASSLSLRQGVIVALLTVAGSGAITGILYATGLA